MKKLAFVGFVLLSTAAAYGDNWPQWRGPNFDGSSDETNLPTDWSRTEDVAWTADLPGPSAATAIIWEDRVFISSADLENNSLLAMCFDRQTGKPMWQHQVAEGISQDYRSTFSAPSPATDGKRVVFFYGTGDMAVFDLDGNQKWARNFGPFAFLWTFSSSPLLHDDKLYLQILQRNEPVDGKGAKDGKNESYLLALNPDTGETLFRQLRPSNAYLESLEAFSTPVPYESNGKTQILIAGGDCLTAHDPETGEEIWRWGTWNPDRIGSWRLVPSPVAGAGVVLACAPKKEPVYAVDATGEGQLEDDAIAWVSARDSDLTSDVPTPAFYDGDFFILSDLRKTLSRVEAKTGRVKWSINTPGRVKYEASPTVADGKVYLINFDGEVAVVDALSGDVLNTIAMSEQRTEHVVRSSVVISNGQLFIRTVDKLYCVGQ